MSGQMMNYKRYMESLENTPEPADDSGNIVIDYTAMIEYASKLTGQANPSGRFILEVDGKMADNAWSIRSTDNHWSNTYSYLINKTCLNH